jgi:hypothetical protein
LDVADLKGVRAGWHFRYGQVYWPGSVRFDVAVRLKPETMMVTFEDVGLGAIFLDYKG